MEGILALERPGFLQSDKDWEDRALKNRIWALEALTGFLQGIVLPKNNTLSEQEVSSVTSASLEGIVSPYQYVFSGISSLVGIQNWATESFKEDWLEFEKEELDLSLLDENSREFFQDFVGSFDPGDNFSEDDLIPNEIY